MSYQYQPTPSNLGRSPAFPYWFGATVTAAFTGPPGPRQRRTRQPDHQLAVLGPRHPGGNPLFAPNPVWPRSDQRASSSADCTGDFVEKTTLPLASTATMCGSGPVEMMARLSKHKAVMFCVRLGGPNRTQNSRHTSLQVTKCRILQHSLSPRRRTC